MNQVSLDIHFYNLKRNIIFEFRGRNKGSLLFTSDCPVNLA